jgi:uncharacterized protein (DUF927 family)
MNCAAIKAVAAAALNHWEAVASGIDKKYQLTGDEAVLLNPRRDDRSRRSFSFNRRTGTWKDFAAGPEAAGADLVSCWAYCRNLGQGAAAEDLAAHLGLDPAGLPGAPERQRDTVRPLAPVPPEALKAIPGFMVWAKAVKHATGENWIVRDLAGHALMLRVRCQPTREKKAVLPFSWNFGKNQWRQGGNFASLFYGLERLQATPDARVLLVEGEKTADAAQVLFPSLVALAYMGADTVRRVDLTPVLGREVIVWPDGDPQGIEAARTLAARIAQEGGRVRLVDLPEPIKAWSKPGKTEPGGWDLADPAPASVDLGALLDGAVVVETTTPQRKDRPARPSAPTDSLEPPDMPPPPGNEDVPPAADGGKPGPAEAQDRPAVNGFEWSARGLMHVKITNKKDEDGNPKPPERIWIAPPFTLPGLERGEGGRGWRLLIGWHDLDGTPHEEALPFELLSGEGQELARLLAQGGMVLPPDTPLRKLLLRYLCQAATKVQARVRLVETLGWQNDAFVLPNGETIGQPEEPVRFVGEVPGGHSLAVRGSLEGWQEGVARFAVRNSRLAFAISAAFAGPLLGLVRPDGGGGFNLMGFSSKGKTTSLECAASGWEDPDRIPTWRATANGLEGIAASRNDGFLPLDEMSQVDPKEAGATAYMLSNGSSKVRAKREGGVRPMHQWRLIFLSSGEQSLEDKVNEDGKVIRAGQEVRVPDIPCPQEGMFEDAHGLPSMGALAEHLKAQARKNYGHAARAFLKGLCTEWDRREALQAKLKSMEAAWLASVVPVGADAQVHRVAGRFALVAVAGELARHLGILPWPEGEAAQAVATCFRAWLDRRGFTGASEVHRGIEAVLGFLERNGQARFDEYGDHGAHVINRAGTKKRAEGPVDGWDFFITPGAWKEACMGFSSASVAKACADAGILELGPKGEHSRTVSIPGHGKPRCYVIRAMAVARMREDGQ